MTETTKPTGRGRDEEAAVRELLEEAGPRSPLPEEDLAAIREAAWAEWWWRYGSEKPTRRVPLWAALAAASLLAAVGLLWWVGVPAPPPAPAAVASLERLTGAAWVRVPGGDARVPLHASAQGLELGAGSELETAAAGEEPGRLALRTAGGASLRLDAGTSIRLASAELVELERGTVYVDSGAEPDGAVAVRTPAGLFQELGTQFEVRVGGGEARTRLRVREGSVRLEREGSSVVAEAGEEITVHADGRVARRQIPIYGPDWSWILEAAPPFDIEGATLQEFLDWLARETGWEIEFADVEAAAIARTCEGIHASIEHLMAPEAASVVLASCELQYRVADGRMVVFEAGEEPR